MRETGGETNLVGNKNFGTQNLVGEKNQFAVVAVVGDMKIIKLPPAAIIKITKPQPCAGFNLASIKQFPVKNGYERLQQR